jgi:hypothetical protein
MKQGSRSIQLTKTFSPIAGKLIAIRIDFSKPPSKAVSFIRESDPRYKRCMASETTFAGFVKQ